MKFPLTIANKTIEETRRHVVTEFIAKTSIKGFRLGKAPANLVEAKVGAKAITEHVLDHVIPKAYADEVHKKNLKPLTMPKINPTNIKKGEDWTFEVESAQRPEVTLGDYKKYLKTALTKLAKTKPPKDAPKPNPEDDPQLVAIFDELLAKATCEVPLLLIEEETNNQLNRLVSQIKKLGLSVEKYLASIKTTPEELQKNYTATATSNLKLEFILDALITDQKIEVSEKDIDALIATVGDEHTKSHLATPREREGIKHMLAKRQLVEKLKKL